MKHVLSFLALGALALGCTTSSNTTTPGDDAGTDAPTLPDGAPIGQPPPTWACAGDATTCLQGTVDPSAFTASFQGGIVELYRVFPSGKAAAVQAEPLAMDRTFAFSGLAAWAHYYVKVTSHFGTGSAAASVATVAGRFAVPSGGTKATIAPIPAVIELLETGAAGNRKLQWVSAHVFDPATAKEQTDGTVTFSAQGIAATPMPYATNVGGTKSFFVAFNPPVAAASGYQVQAAGRTWTIATEPDFAGAITSPTDGATLSANAPLDVSWPMQPSADYMTVELFSRSGGTFTSVFSSGDPLAPDVTMLTIPGTSLSATGAYLLNVNAARAACRLQSDGCAYLLEAGSANLTVH